MANKLGEAPVIHEWSAEEKETMQQSYSCSLIFERATPEQIRDKSLPTDTLQVRYTLNGQVHTDLCRGKRVDVFNLYYDKFGKGALLILVGHMEQSTLKCGGIKHQIKRKENERRTS